MMVQVQSTWFPLYDRNPQTFVPNIMKARPKSYKPATITIYGDTIYKSSAYGNVMLRSRLILPVVP